ncbi:alternative sulfate transporter [Auriculariales sp. MPI-PUGE-AT-0066]|nr:alternative sulfate transporter [Auriculariales sp. MPI-PUGE-AT-0066]
MSKSSYIDEQVHTTVDGRERALLVPDWTPEEETRARRKVDFVVMPLLMLGFFALQLDRGNIGNALTDNFRGDVGINQDQYNVGQQLLSTGIKWLSFQVLAFGLVSTFQAFQHGYGSFLATRLLLGLTESGYIPGSLYAITTWYTRKETAKRVMIFFVGNLGAAASTNLIAYGVLHMRGVGGKPGWFWLFILMGLFSILIGIILALLLPDSVHKPTPWLLPRIQYFTERELYILRRRVHLDDPTKAAGPIRIHGRDIVNTLKNWRLWPHVFITLCNNGPLTGFNNYAPTIVNSFGFDRLRSNALASIGPWILIPVSVTFSVISDKFKFRAQTTTAALTAHWVFMIVAQRLSYTDSRPRRFASVVLVQSINFTTHPLNVAWMTLHCRNSTERAIALAMAIMSANCAGIYGAQLLRADDSPRYHRGFLVMVVILSAALVAALFQWSADSYLVRKAAAKGEVDLVDEKRRGLVTPESVNDEERSISHDHKT